MRGALLVTMTLVAACGGSVRELPTRQGPAPPPKLDAVKPAAMREYDGAMRAIRLGGPEAYDAAQGRLEQAVELDASLWEAWHNLGVIASENGEHDKAIGDFDKALSINRSHTPTRLARAEAHRRAGNGDKARADFKASLDELADNDPLRPEAAARLAAALRDAGSYDDGIAALRDSLRRSGPSPRIYTELGLIYLAQKRLDMVQLVLTIARDLAEERIKLEKDRTPPSSAAVAAANAGAAPVYNALALLAMQQGKAQESFARFDHATELDPKYVDARFNKASVLLDAGDYERAKKELDQVIDLAPDDLAAQVSLGIALRGLKDYKAAEKTYERVIRRGSRRDPSRADALFDLAVLKADFMQSIPEGKRMLEQYMQDAPGNHPKRQAAEDKRKELGL